MKYIQDFYDKYHSQHVPVGQNSQEDADLLTNLERAAEAQHPINDQGEPN